MPVIKLQAIIMKKLLLQTFRLDTLFKIQSQISMIDEVRVPSIISVELFTPIPMHKHVEKFIQNKENMVAFAREQKSQSAVDNAENVTQKETIYQKLEYWVM